MLRVPTLMICYFMQTYYCLICVNFQEFFLRFFSEKQYTNSLSNIKWKHLSKTKTLYLLVAQAGKDVFYISTLVGGIILTG